MDKDNDGDDDDDDDDDNNDDDDDDDDDKRAGRGYDKSQPDKNLPVIVDAGTGPAGQQGPSGGPVPVQTTYSDDNKADKVAGGEPTVPPKSASYMDMPRIIKGLGAGWIG